MYARRATTARIAERSDLIINKSQEADAIARVAAPLYKASSASSDAEQGKFEEAGPFCLRAIDITEKALGPYHPNVAAALGTRLAGLRAQVWESFVGRWSVHEGGMYASTFSSLFPTSES